MGTPMDTMKAQVGKLEAQLNRWNAKLDELATMTENEAIENKTYCRKRIGELRVKHRLVKSKLEELKSGGFDKWVVFKADLDRSWKVFEKAFKKLRVRLKSESAV